jgi:hypothetical protein
MHRNIWGLNLGVCIRLRELDQVEGFPSKETLFQSFLTILFQLSWRTYKWLLGCLHPVACIRSGTFSKNLIPLYTNSAVANHVNFQCIYFLLKMVVRPKHVADNLNKIVNNYWTRAALDGNPSISETFKTVSIWIAVLWWAVQSCTRSLSIQSRLLPPSAGQH